MEGVTINIGGIQKLIRVALLCVACDTPAARKVSGFVGHSANLGCPRCYCEFSEGGLARNRSNLTEAPGSTEQMLSIEIMYRNYSHTRQKQ